ncbi:hypothetical protein MKW92_041862, partial [Papaver armeniacum]
MMMPVSVLVVSVLGVGGGASVDKMSSRDTTSIGEQCTMHFNFLECTLASKQLVLVSYCFLALFTRTAHRYIFLGIIDTSM